MSGAVLPQSMTLDVTESRYGIFALIRDFWAAMIYLLLFVECYKYFAERLQAIWRVPQSTTAGTEILGFNVAVGAAVVCSLVIVSVAVGVAIAVSGTLGAIGGQVTSLLGTAWGQVGGVGSVWGIVAAGVPWSTIVGAGVAHVIFLVGCDVVVFGASVVIKLVVGL
jgi:hypothetical protein